MSFYGPQVGAFPLSTSSIEQLPVSLLSKLLLILSGTQSLPYDVSIIHILSVHCWNAS